MVKKLLFDRQNIACRGDIWLAKGEFEIVNGKAEKIGPDVVPDKPWEKSCLNWLSVHKDGDKYRMYYEAFSDPEDDFGSRLCYAESDDLIHWTKPELGICDFNGNKNNNIVLDTAITNGMGVHGHSIYIDPNSPEYAKYRLVFLGSLRRNDDTKQGFISFAYSGDGIHWKHGAPEIPFDYNHLPVTSFGSDTQSTVFWDSTIRKYVGYFRTLDKNGCRSIGRSESSDGVHWNEPVTIIKPDIFDDLNTDYYNNAATKVSEDGDTAYYIFYSYFNHTTETLDIRLATSRDGITFDRHSRKSLVPNGTEFDAGSLYAAAGVHNLSDGRQCVFYSGSNRRHCDPILKNESCGNYVIAAFEKDRFQGIGVKNHFEFTVNGHVNPSCPEVYINAEIRGEIRGELVDDEGNVVPGFSKEDCLPLTGNGTFIKMNWNGKTGPDERVWLKLYINNSDIYSVYTND